MDFFIQYHPALRPPTMGAEPIMLWMVIERFKDRDPRPIYQRVREQGRSLPEGLKYIESWVEVNFDRCFQLMECDDAKLFMQWAMEWRDLAEFEFVPVCASLEVRALFNPASGPALPDST